MRTQRVHGATMQSLEQPQQATGLISGSMLRNMSYEAVLASQGVERGPSGELRHRMSIGPGRYRWYPVALSLADARNLTRDTGTRHDFYATGLSCKDCQGVNSGWVLGGRKLQAEHEHVTRADFEEYPDEYDAVDEAAAPAAVGA